MASIIIADDSAFTRRTHRRILESDGHVVLEAASGMAALESFAVNRPDLLLLDLTMEDMSGLDVLTRVLEMDSTARVVVISADVQRSTAQLVADAGALRFLGKPVTSETLLGTVRELLSEIAS
jgi:Response regulator containing CheY-like receiver, AAA-type ATPase, and DNA-binding domains